MICQTRGPLTHSLLIPAFLFIIALSPVGALSQENARKIPQEAAELTLVRVNITIETLGGSESVMINGKRISDYQPKLIHVFPSTGIVMDEVGHVLTFLGYRWVDLQGPAPRIDLITQRGQRYKGQLIGIDQNIGVAVIKSLGGKLRKTPLCGGCQIKDGITVVSPVLHDGGVSQLQKAQIVSIGHAHESSTPEVWTFKVNRSLPGIGEPLLDTEHRVLGFVSSQKPSADDPAGVSLIVYHPMSQLLSSADKILKAGGDIRTGWLGVFLDPASPVTRSGLTIDNIQEGSPAQKAGLVSGDIIAKYDGKEVLEALHFIRLVQDTPIGSRVSLDVLRNGKPLTLHALIEARKPVASPGKFVFNFPEVIPLAGASEAASGAGVEPAVGIEMVPLTPQLADFLAVPGKVGLLVLSVEPRTPFGLAGVQAGDVILSADGQLIQNPQGLLAHLKARSKNAGTMILRLFRKGSEGVATIELPLNGSTPKPQP